MEPFASPIRSSVGSVLASLPPQSLAEPTYNCFLEHYVEPLTLELAPSTPQSSPSSRDAGKSKKSLKVTPGKLDLSLNPSPDQAVAMISSKELEQAAEWSASAIENAKTNPDMAYKMFAKAGQIFAKNFRTREAAQNYYSVVQLQVAILKSKYPEMDISQQGVPFSMVDVMRSTRVAEEKTKQSIIASLLVLFKSNLYLARLLHPFDLSLSSRFFSNTIDCIFPASQMLSLARSVQLDTSPLPQYRCSIDYVQSSCHEIASEIIPAMQFIDLQRKQASASNPNGPPFVPFSMEAFNTAREVAFILSSQETDPLSIVLLIMAYALSPPLAEALPMDPEKDSLRRASLFRTLGHPHRQADCLFEYAMRQWPSSDAVEAACSAMHRGIFIDDQTRLRRYWTELTPKLASVENLGPIHLLYRLSAILLRSDVEELDNLLVESWVVRLLTLDVQLSATLMLVKSRL